jgi:tRNA pseudouridine55 synthase
MARIKKGLEIDGIINLDKPLGLSSNQALQKVKFLLNAKKAGHTGSLDPLATGVLPLCFGHSTKVSSLLLGSDKRYQAGIFLGHRTTTADREGELIGPISHEVVDEQIMVTVLEKFKGVQQQFPPMHSALKFQGQPLYKLARKGIDIELKSREITIHSLELISYNYPELLVDVCCSKGTYIRSLAEDIGNALGCGAHLFSLRRTQAGNFKIDESVTLDYLQELKKTNQLNSVLSPSDAVLQHLLAIHLSKEQADNIRFGRQIKLNSESYKATSNKQQVRIYEANNFLGIAELITGLLPDDEFILLQPKRLFC